MIGHILTLIALMFTLALLGHLSLPLEIAAATAMIIADTTELRRK